MRSTRRKHRAGDSDWARRTEAGRARSHDALPVISEIRERTGLSQSQFSALLGGVGSNAAGMGARTARAIGRRADAAHDRGEESTLSTRSARIRAQSRHPGRGTPAHSVLRLVAHRLNPSIDLFPSHLLLAHHAG